MSINEIRNIVFAGVFKCLAVFAILLFYGCLAQSSTTAMRALWPIIIIDNAASVTGESCGTWPKPVKILSTETRYDQNDLTRTQIDPVSSAAYEKLIAPVREFSQRVVGLANNYSLSIGKDQQSAFCASRALYIWAVNQALGEATTDIANFNRATFLSAVSSAYIQLKSSRYLSVKERAAIEPWLSDLAQKTRVFYEGKRQATQIKPNNIQYWGGLAVAMAGVALNQTDNFDWGIKVLELGACTATAEGALPRELERKERARHYHMFALQPLVALAELAERNGRPGYSVCGGALHRIIAFTLRSIDNPIEIEVLSGAKQLALDQPPKSDNDLAWLEIYMKRFPAFAWAGRMPGLRPYANSNLGGKLTELYSLK